MTKDLYNVIKSPVITEKMTALNANENKVAFWVDIKAGKGDVKAAVEKIFNVKVTAVNTQRVPGKVKRMGRFAGRSSTRKKAFVTLKKGDKIPIFEGV